MFSNELLRNVNITVNKHAPKEERQSYLAQQVRLEDDDSELNKYFTRPSTIHQKLTEDSLARSQTYEQSRDYEKLVIGQQNQQHIPDNECQIEYLKEHLLTIQKIAMNQIDSLKKMLQEQRNEKNQLQKKLQELKLRTCNNQKTQTSKFEGYQNQTIRILKQQNKILKEALKKQLHINKNLIKSSIMEERNQKDTKMENEKQFLLEFNVNNANEQKPSQKYDNSEVNKQNIHMNSNFLQLSHKDIFKAPLIDRPSIPHPSSHSKRQSLR